VNCTDFAGNTANSTNRTLLIDTYPPVINLTSPSNNSNTNANVTFRWNATDVGSVITCNLTVDGVNNVTGIVGVSGVQFERNITGIPPGTHLWNATCWDDLNQANTSETWTFSISNADLVLNESPRISFNNTNPNENQTILISANVTNIGGVDALTNTTFWDGDPGTGGTYIGSAVLNVPYNGSTVFSVAWNITNGNHEIHARADPAGSIVELLETNNNASRNISILKAYFNAPPNATLTSDTTPEVNFTLQDFTSGTLTYRIYVDGAYNGQTGTGTDNVSVLLNLSTLANGARSIIVQANDSSRAKNSTPLTIIVDNTPPQLAYVNATPADNHVQNTTSAIINVTHNETYPDTVILYWDGAQDTIKPYSGNFTNFTKTGLGDGIYTYYVWANDTLGNTNTTAARTLRVDFNAPNITLLAPANGSTVTSNAVPFVFNVNDSSQYVNCTLSINGTANKTINNLLTNTPQEIAQLLDDGTYLWGISCVDQMNRTNVSENRTVTVAFSPTIWQGIWFERYTANFPNATAIINLSNSRDNTENNMFKNVSGFGLATLANATSPYIGGMGAYIPAQTFTAFSGVFRSEGRDNYITWIASIVNDSGHFVIAQSGTNNDNNSGNNRVFPEDTKVTLSGNQTLGNAIYLAPLDRLELVVNTYNDHGNTWNTTHYWDFRSNSFVNFTTFYTLGKVIVNLTEPAGTTVVNPWAVFNMTCLANCTYGTCINTTVYAQYSTPSMNWTNINGTSGSLTLAAGQQNGISLGNLTNATNVTFSINGSQISSNTIRCAISSLANALAPGTPLVVVNDTEAPTVTLVSPPNNNHTRQVNITFSFNATDNIAIVNCSLFINGVFNQTNQSGITNGTPNNITVNDMAEGIYNWSVLCLDYNANPGWSAVWNLTIDKTSPAITLNAPNNSQNFTTRYVGLNYTPIDVYSSVLACFITLDGANVNQSMVANNTAHTSITSSLGEGNHLWNATCADLANNTNTSETRNFNVFIPPQVVRLSPANGTTTNNQTIAFLFNVSDETGIANCSLLIDEAYNETKSTAAITHNGTNNFTVTFGTSVRLQWAIICVDNTSYASANRTDNRTLTIDLAPPNPQFVTANSTWFSTATPTITFNITDNFDTNISYTLFIDGVANVSGYVANGTNANLVLGALANGTYTLIMQGTDDAPNAANSTPLTIYVDTAAPNVTLLTPANGSTMNTTSVVLNFTANDNMAPWLICNLTLDGAVIQSNINLTNGSMYNTTVTAATGTHYWNATCIDLAANRGTSQSWSFIIQAPDLIITAGNITVSNNTPIENQTIVVNATIFNIGNLAASNITVQFYDGDPSFGGVQIGANQTIANLGIGGNTSLNTTYLAHIGLNRIYVVVDPPIATNGTISEENESNNIAYAAFVVGLFEVFSGISSNTLRISDALIIDAFTWNQTETSGSNIFVADSESTITFPALMAIGRNTTNGTGTGANDFEEIDARINATNLTDNVNATFTSTGIPLGLRNITAYKRPIIDIPFINSTNSTNFMTGIVWDANDGGPYYNGSQDVAFVSVINQSMQGLYGIYDYEVLVPATLRDYIPGGGTVTFYVELR
jgi:hypothetical protein